MSPTGSTSTGNFRHNRGTPCSPVAVVVGIFLFPAARKFSKVSLAKPSRRRTLSNSLLLLLINYAGIRLLPPNLRSSNTSRVPRRAASVHLFEVPTRYAPKVNLSPSLSALPMTSGKSFAPREGKYLPKGLQSSIRPKVDGDWDRATRN